MAPSILGGIAKGLKLKVPDLDTVRPMGVLLKRRVFDANQDHRGRVFVDLCSGCGGVGLEAWSRGGQEVYLNELDPAVYKLIKKNCESIHGKWTAEYKKRPVHLSLGDAESFITTFEKRYRHWPEKKRQNTTILLAPPYRLHAIYRQLISNWQTSWFEGDIWIESENKVGLSLSEIEKLWRTPDKVYCQGESFIAVYKSTH